MTDRQHDPHEPAGTPHTPPRHVPPHPPAPPPAAPPPAAPPPAGSSPAGPSPASPRPAGPPAAPPPVTGPPGAPGVAGPPAVPGAGIPAPGLPGDDVPGRLDCPDVHHDLGAYVLGALDRERMRLVREHIASCADCREAYDELSGIPSFLARLTPAEAEATGPAVAEPPARVLAAAAHRVHRARKTRRIAVAAAAVVAVAAGVGGWLAGAAGDDDGTSAAGRPDPAVSAPPSPGSPSPSPGGGSRTASGVQGPVQANVRFGPSSYGTAVDLSLTGVRPGTRCQLDVYGTRGRQETASSWLVPPASYGPGVTVPGGTSISPDEILRFEVVVVGGDSEPIVRIEPPRPVP